MPSNSPSACAEFATDALDVTVDRAVVDETVIAISRIEQLIAGLHHPRTLGQRLEDQEFGDGQLHLSARAHTMRCRSASRTRIAPHHFADRVRHRPHWGRQTREVAAEDRADTCDEQSRAKNGLVI